MYGKGNNLLKKEVIHISYSACGFTHYNERVRVKYVSTSTYRKFEIVGMYGVIKKYASGKYGVLLDNERNPASREGLFWIKSSELKFVEDESEDIKMEGFNRIAIVNLLEDYSKKDYAFALYDTEFELLLNSRNDEEEITALVVTNAGGKNKRVLGKVKRMMFVEEYGKGVTAQVVGVVNMDAYIARVNEENRLKEIAKKKAEIEKALDAEIKKRKDAEYYEEMAKKYSDNPLIGQLVAELKGLGA